MNKWLMLVAERIAPRLVAHVLVTVAALLFDAGLLDGAVYRALVSAISGL